MKLIHTGHEVQKCAKVPGHTKKFVFQWFNSCYRPFVFHFCIILYNFLVCNILLNLYVYVISVRYIYSNVWFQCKTSECLVSFKFLSMSCMGSTSDHFITKSCYYQTKIFAGLLICVLVSFSRAVNYIFFTYLFFIAQQYQCTR